MAQTQANQPAGQSPFPLMPLMGQQAGGQIGAQAGQQAAAINGYLNIDPALMRQITQHVQALPPNSTPAQQLAAVQGLFNVLRHGGTLGLTWQDSAGREPRSPSDVLRARSGDCDELSTLFYAAARQLGIDVRGFRLSTMTLMSGGASVVHAPLLLEMGGNRYIVDPIMPSTVPVRDFSDATLIGVFGPYFNLSSQGPSAATAPVTIQNRNDFSTQADIVTVELLERAMYNSRLGTPAGTAGARRDLEDVVRIGSGGRYISGQRDVVAQNVYNAYFRPADAAFGKGARDASVIQGYTDSLAIIRLVPSIARANEASVYRTHGALGIFHRDGGRPAQARAEFAEQIRLRPKDPVGHRNLINLEFSSGNRRAALAACDAALLGIPQGPDYNAIRVFRNKLAANIAKNP